MRWRTQSTGPQQVQFLSRHELLSLHVCSLAVQALLLQENIERHSSIMRLTEYNRITMIEAKTYRLAVLLRKVWYSIIIVRSFRCHKKILLYLIEKKARRRCVRKAADQGIYNDHISIFARRRAQGSNQNHSNARISPQKPILRAVVQGENTISRPEMLYNKLSVSIEYYLKGDSGRNNVGVER